MSGQLSSELLKLRTTRMAGLLLLAAAGLTLLGVFVEGASASAAELTGDDQQRTRVLPQEKRVLGATLGGVADAPAKPETHHEHGQRDADGRREPADEALQRQGPAPPGLAAGAGGHAGKINPIALVQEVREWFDGTLALSGAIGRPTASMT